MSCCTTACLECGGLSWEACCCPMQKRHQLQLQTGQNLTLAGDQKLCQGTSADGDQVNLAYCQLTNHAAPQFHVAATPKHAVLAPYPPPQHTHHTYTPGLTCTLPQPLCAAGAQRCGGQRTQRLSVPNTPASAARICSSVCVRGGGTLSFLRLLLQP